MIAVANFEHIWIFSFDSPIILDFQLTLQTHVFCGLAYLSIPPFRDDCQEAKNFDGRVGRKILRNWLN